MTSPKATGADVAESNDISDSVSEALDNKLSNGGVCVDLKALAAWLEEVAADNDDDLEVLGVDNDLLAPADWAAQQAQLPRVRLFLSTAPPIPLSEVSSFLDKVVGVEDSLGVFWKSRIQNLRKEHGVYATISSESTLDLSNN